MAGIGERLIGYDTEAGKGDRETPYRFTTPERLIADFLADLRAMRLH
jgi:hypothetical protein